MKIQEKGIPSAWRTAPVVVGTGRRRRQTHLAEAPAIAPAQGKLVIDTRRLTHVVGLSLLIGFVVVGIGQLFLGVVPQDEGELIVYPQLIALGKLPYRDIWMMYPPGSFLIIASALKLGLPGMLAERSVSLLARFAYMLVVNRLLSGSWRRLSPLALLLVGTLLLAYNDIRAYPWVIALPLFLLGMHSLREHPWRASAWFLLAATVRFELGAAGLIATTALAVLSEREARPRRLLAASGLAAGCGVFFGVLGLLTGGDALREIFYDPIVIAPYRHIPLWPPQFSWAGVPLVLTMTLGPLVLLVLGLRRRMPYLAATNLAMLALLTHFYQRPDWQYMLWVAAAILPWIVACLFELHTSPSLEAAMRRWAATSIRFVRVLVAWNTLLFVVYIAYFGPLSPTSAQSAGSSSERTVRGAGHVILTAARYQAVDDRQVIRYIEAHVTPGQRVFVGPIDLRHATWNMTALYYVLPLPPANRYLEMNPGIETTASVEREIVRSLGPRTWVILWRESDSFVPPGDQPPGSALLQHYIRAHYVPVLRNRSYLLLQPRVFGPAG